MLHVADALGNKKGWGSKSAASFTKSKKSGHKSRTSISGTHQKATTLGKSDLYVCYYVIWIMRGL